MTLFEHVPHPHAAARKAQGPVKVADQHPAGSAYARFNARVAQRVTAAVGSMSCAYLFTAIALVSLPAALATGSVIVIVSWFAQTLVQLVLLSVILVGQGIQGAAADKRAESTYLDAEAILHGLDQHAAHLTAQDQHLLAQDDALAGLLAQLAALTPPATGESTP